jgi:hypothetical protein
MSANNSVLPRVWFLLVALFALAIAGGGFALIRSTANHQSPPPIPPPIRLDEPVIKKSIDVLQLDESNHLIPWGSAAPNAVLQLIVSGLPQKDHFVVAFALATNVDGPYVEIDNSTPTIAIAKGLAPGSYWWHAMLTVGDDTPMTLQHPRSTPPNPDFIILPQLGTPEDLEQTDLNGTHLALGATSESGVLLGARLNPRAVMLEVQVSSASSTWESSDTLSVALNQNGLTVTQFAGPAGPFRWRARAQAADGAVSRWTDFSVETVHFVLAPAKPAPENYDSVDEKNGTTQVTPPMSSGGDGPNTPHRSVVKTLPSLWEVICRPWLLCLAGGSLLTFLVVFRRKVILRPPTP